MEEPYGLKPADIATLTDAQIVGMYGRPRDEKTGVPKPVGVEGGRKFTTPEETKETMMDLVAMFGGKAKFMGLMQKMGKSEAEAASMWRQKSNVKKV